jgi:hypothetical protein
MKRLILVIFTLLCSFSLFAQDSNSIISGLEYNVLRIGPLDPWANTRNAWIDAFKDVIEFDSIRKDTQYYTVKRHYFQDYNSFSDVDEYQILLANGQMFFSGLIYSNIDSIKTKQLVYDFNLAINDTFNNSNPIIFNDIPLFNCPIKLAQMDSIKLGNGEFYKMQLFNFSNECNFEEYQFSSLFDCVDSFYSIENVGSACGLLPFQIEGIRNWYGWSNTRVISICEKGKLLHSYPCIKERFGHLDLCSQAGIDSVYESFNTYVSLISIINESISVYPNPAMNTLKINGADEFTFQIMALSGKTVLTGYSQKQIDISNLPSGVYHLSLVLNKTVLNTQFMKN